MSYRQISQEYGEDSDEEGIELRTSSGPRHLGPTTALHRLTSATNCTSSTLWQVSLFLVGLIAVYLYGVHEGKHVTTVSDIGTTAGGGNDPFKTFHAEPSDTTTPQPTPSPQEEDVSEAKFTMQKLIDTRAEVETLLRMLEEYYTDEEQTKKMLLDAWTDPWDFDASSSENDENESANSRRVNKLVDTMARALVSDDQTAFLMGGIGSSVMAGHDNCHFDAYQNQMERTFGGIWEKAGMEFVFQNAGEGGGCGDSHENQVFCVNQNVSPNVDIVHYEWTYFEHGGAAPQHEQLIRWTQMLPKQPPLHIYNTGVRQPEANSDDKFADHYAHYGYNVWYQRTGFDNGGHDYEAEKKMDPPLDRFAWGQHGDGYHERTRYGELETDEVRRESLEVVMRNWHPGPMGFQLTADAFSYVYAKAIHKALELIEKDMNDGNDPRDTWSASLRPMMLKRDLPDPLVCDPLYCTVDDPPGCLNFELPTYGNWGARIEDPKDDLNPHLGEVQNWSLWHQDNDIWTLVAKEDISYFRDRDDKEICRHLDACGGISAQKAEDGMVVFRLPKMEVGLVVICGCCGKDVGDVMFKSNPDIEILYNTVKLDPSTFEIWPNPKCVRLLSRFPTSGRESETPTGHAYLAIKVLKDMPQVIRVSHVITI